MAPAEVPDHLEDEHGIDAHTVQVPADIVTRWAEKTGMAARVIEPLLLAAHYLHAHARH
ncbi:hypothetical protein [Streptosporangium canum]|uniref:hypothetical protein n=1 Tax=Streptosporangium canum TaxID=324952 RepID=UPI0037894CAF